MGLKQLPAKASGAVGFNVGNGRIWQRGGRLEATHHEGKTEGRMDVWNRKLGKGTPMSMFKQKFEARDDPFRNIRGGLKIKFSGRHLP